MRVSIPILLALAVGCATGAVMRDVVAPARAQGQAGANYEYDVVAVAHNIDDDKQALAKYGHEGWRLVATTDDGHYRRLYFERQLAR
jgi:hypothetical protein